MRLSLIPLVCENFCFLRIIHVGRQLEDAETQPADSFSDDEHAMAVIRFLAGPRCPLRLLEA